MANEHKHNHIGLHPKPCVDTCRREAKSGVVLDVVLLLQYPPARALTKRQFCRKVQIRQGMKTQQVRRQQKQQDTAADGRQARMHHPDQHDRVHGPIGPGQRGERNTVRWVKRHCAVHGGAGEREPVRRLCTDVSQIDPCSFPRTFVADHVRVQNKSSVFVAQHVLEKTDDGGTCGCVQQAKTTNH